MTTFAPTISPRWKGTYVAGGVQHTLQLRSPRGATFADIDTFARAAAQTMFGAVLAFLADDYSWVQAEIALTDSDVFLPATTPTVASPGLVALSTFSATKKISAVTLTGKSATARARFSMFGLFIPADNPGDIGEDGNLTPAELAGLATIIATANTNARAADGSQATYHSRATYKENDHLLKLVRRGIIT